MRFPYRSYYNFNDMLEPGCKFPNRMNEHSEHSDPVIKQEIPKNVNSLPLECFLVCRFFLQVSKESFLPFN